MTEAFVSFHHSWNGTAWTGDLQKLYDDKMGEDKLILSTVKLNDNAKDVLVNNQQLNKLFSSMLDAYDDLPYRPDTSFDFCWRAFEILMSMMADDFGWKKKMKKKKQTKGADGSPKDGDDLKSQMFSDVCKKIHSLTTTNTNVEKTLKNLNEHCSMSGINFMLQRLVNTKKRTVASASLIVEDQYKHVVKRIANAVGYDFYEYFCDEYYDREEKKVGSNEKKVNTNITADHNHKASRLIKLYLLAGKEITLPPPSKPSSKRKKFPAFSTAQNMELIVSGILYTSRCYRFHGDYFSPFKSVLSTLNHYYEYNYFLIYTYSMFWYLLYCYLDIHGIDKFFTLDAVNDCVERCLKNLDKLPNE